MRRAVVQRAVLVLLVAAATVVAGSGVAAAKSGAKPAVAGTWSGTWQRTSAPPTTGTMTLTLAQKGNALSGKEAVVGSACLTTNKVKGTVHGTAVTFSVSQTGISASYQGAVSGSKLSGTLQVTCGSLTGKGKFSLTRQ